MTDETISSERYTWRARLHDAIWSVQRPFLRAFCRTVGHRTSVDNFGFGFGRFDYWCKRCHALAKSVAQSDLSEAEMRAVVEFGGAALFLDDEAAR